MFRNATLLFATGGATITFSVNLLWYARMF